MLLLSDNCSHRFTSAFPPVKEILKESKWAAYVLYQELIDEFGAVNCHNDGHMLNIIANDQRGKIWKSIFVDGYDFCFLIISKWTVYFHVIT